MSTDSIETAESDALPYVPPQRGDALEITKVTVLREALLRFAGSTLGRERAIAESLAAQAEVMAEVAQ